MTTACPGTIDWSIVTHNDYRLVNSLRDVNYRLVNSLRDVTKSWRHQVMHAADWFKHHIFYPSSLNNYPIWKILKLTCSLLYFLTVCFVKKILQPHLNPLVRCFGSMLYFFYCSSWHLPMSCDKTNTDHWFAQYESWMTLIKFMLPSALPRSIWIFPQSYKIHIALTTSPYLCTIS